MVHSLLYESLTQIVMRLQTAGDTHCQSSQTMTSILSPIMNIAPENVTHTTLYMPVLICHCSDNRWEMAAHVLR